MRLVFVADQADPGSGLRAFDIPLVYITADRFNQPVFVCNNLTGAL
jgi:fructose 1,6-bisphosphatase